jgi:hypothetical protein
MAAGKHESKYKKEDNWGERNECGDSEFDGPKSSDRDKTMCGNLTVLGQTTLNSTEVVPPEITVGGRVFVPTTLRYVSDVTLGAGGRAAEGGEPSLQASYATIVVLAEKGSDSL